MKYNLRALRAFSFFGDIGLMFKTVFAVLGKDYSDKEIK
jgi:lipopolysaccharide/colanic/teichoic acid biosynthesis glycosyltransferase